MIRVCGSPLLLLFIAKIEIIKEIGLFLYFNIGGINMKPVYT
jgi:hypothetical protein